MVIYNAATRELTAKIVYYGPGLGGKTTNLHLLHERLEPGTVGKLLNLATTTDRTIYFDLLPVELGDIKGYKIRFQLATVPGQTAFNETRRVVLKGTDGIVFVADSQWTMLPKNLESWQNLKENLKANAVSFEGIPIVIQYNKRDLSDILSVDALQEALGLSSYPFVEAVASAGRGVTETFKLISKLTFVDLLRRLQGRRPEEPGPVAPRRESDDLLSWKDSLLNRVNAAPSAAASAGASAAPTSTPTPEPAPSASAPKRPLALVPSLPSLPEEAPFETGDEAPDVHPEAAPDTDAPFGSPQLPSQTTSPAVSTTGPISTAAAPAGASEPSAAAGASPFDTPAPASAGSAFDDLALPDMPPLPKLTEIHVREPASRSPEPQERSLAADAMPFVGIPRLPEEPAPAATAAIPAVSPEPAQAEADPAAPVTMTAEAEERIRALENALAEAVAGIARERDDRSRAEEATEALRVRLEAFERDTRSLGKSLSEKQQAFGERIEELAGAARGQEQLGERLRELQERLTAEAKRTRTSEDDVSMALRSFGERGEKLSHQVASIAVQVEALEAALRDKTGQSRREADDIRAELETLRGTLDERIGHGRREAEDIRSQLAPLLEAHGTRNATDERLSQEFDRLRESLAESLGDLSERLRRAVGGR